MELETKHIAPYLPYKLKCQVKDLGKTIVAELHSVYADGTCTFCDTIESEKGFDYVKPILQPLSNDNFDYDIFLMDNFPKEQWADAYNDIMAGIGFGVQVEQIPYVLFEFLLKNHIDVFGLIEKGLAIDINTLSTQNDG